MVGDLVDLVFTGGGVACLLLDASRLRALGVTGARRLAVAPAAPAFAENAVSEFEWTTAQALFAPSGSPAAAVDWINLDAGRLIATQSLAARWEAMSMELADNASEKFAHWVKAQSAEMAALIRSADIRVEWGRSIGASLALAGRFGPLRRSRVPPARVRVSVAFMTADAFDCGVIPRARPLPPRGVAPSAPQRAAVSSAEP